MKWNVNHIVEFLKVYQQYPVLWNIKNKDYCNTKVKDEIFQQLFSALNEKQLVGKMDVKQLKAKIKSIKDVCRQELHKIDKSKKSGCGADDIYMPKLAWFNEANYLTEVLATRNSKSNLDTNQLIQTNQEIVQDEASETSRVSVGCDNKYNNCSEEHLKNKSPAKMRPPVAHIKKDPAQNGQETVPDEGSETLRVSVGCDKYNCSEERLKIKLPAKMRPPVTPIKKVKRRAESEISEMIHQLDKISQNTAEERPYEQFGKFVASELRQLPQRQAILLQQEIQNCIIRSKLSTLENVVYLNPQQVVDVEFSPTSNHSLALQSDSSNDDDNV